jgi:hypothetical protein
MFPHVPSIKWRQPGVLNAGCHSIVIAVAEPASSVAKKTKAFKVAQLKELKVLILSV